MSADYEFKGPNVDPELKPKYGAFLAEEPDAYKAALMVYPDNYGYAAYLANNWINDPIVIRERERVKKEIGISLLPDKAELAQKVWDMMDKAYETEDKIKAAKLYAEIRGFIEKTPAATINNTFSPKVIQTKDHGSDDDWEAAAAKQQTELLNVATSRH